MEYNQFMNEVQRRLPANFPATAKVSIRAVFQTLHHRIDEGQAGQIETHLPQELKKDWEFPNPQQQSGEEFDRQQFLEDVRQLAGLQDLTQAREAADVVFTVLKLAIPRADVHDTATELPPNLRHLWLEADA